jgi:hypothetical protein
VTRDPQASVDIDATIEHVWAVMLDTEAYAEWNPFVVRAECATPPRVGEPILLHVKWADGRGTTSRERIVALEPPRDEDGVRRATLAYVYEGLPARLGLVRGTRYQRLSQSPGAPTRYETVEEFSGPLVRLAGPGRVENGFRRHAEALRVRCEGSGAPGHL